MWTGFPLFPEQASTFARDVDALYLFLVAVSGFFSVLIFALVFFFAIRYRRQREDEIPEAVHGSLALEIAWSVLPLLLCAVMFGWGAKLYFDMTRPPSNALQMWVVGKQWMWKIQHPEGRREINELHVPLGQPVKLTMTSEDVIHSFYIPAFRVKQDVLPGRYSTLWFQATAAGEYHLFCAEYCGTKHSGMIGKVVVMEAAAYERWLAGTPSHETMEQAGERLFVQNNCNTCHHARADARGPVLDGVFGKPVKLESGATITADEAYVRESILNPGGKVVAGYRPVMPTYQGQISEEGVMQLIAYIKSLAREQKKQD
jgi:cytochrome c oxidase subunit 2